MNKIKIEHTVADKYAYEFTVDNGDFNRIMGTYVGGEEPHNVYCFRKGELWLISYEDDINTAMEAEEDDQAVLQYVSGLLEAKITEEELLHEAGSN